MNELLEKFPTAEAFWEGLSGEYSGKALVEALAADFGLACERLPKKRDTFDAAYQLLREAAATGHGRVQESPEPPGETAPGPGALGVLPPAEAPEPGKRFQVRSRQAEGRWRCSRHWGAPWVIIPEGELLPSDWDELRADPMIEVRELV